MDQTFFKLVEIWEKWSRQDQMVPAVLLLAEIVEYGIEKGLLKDKDIDSKESDECIMFRAANGADLSREMLGEDLGPVSRMSPEQHKKIIQATETLGEATMRLCTEELAALEKKPAGKH